MEDMGFVLLSENKLEPVLYRPESHQEHMYRFNTYQPILFVSKRI